MPAPKPKRAWVEEPNKYGRFEYLEERDGVILHCSGYTAESNKRFSRAGVKTFSENPVRQEDWYSKDKWPLVAEALDKLKTGQYDPVPDPV